MMTDFEKLRKDLTKEREENEKLRVKIRSLEVEGQHHDKELRDTRSRLEVESAKTKPSMSTMDSQGWKSAVQTRMYEEKIRSLEADLEKKTKQLKDTKVLLRDAAEREQTLTREKDELQQKVAILERFPAGSGAVDSNLTLEFQQARLKVERLENEKKELLAQVRLSRRGHQAGDGADPGVITEDVVSKASGYDKMTREVIDVRMELKAVELEKDKYRKEVDKLKKELGNFGPEFFEEIEDLKYNYKQSVQRNVLLEEKVKQVARQFGVSIDIPGFD